MKLKTASVALCGFLMNVAQAESLNNTNPLMNSITPKVLSSTQYPALQANYSFPAIKALLKRTAPDLPNALLEKVMSVLQCSEGTPSLNGKHILTLIDYSLPSSKKRLWIFDLDAQKLLFHTYVSHGIKSGVYASNYFSNQYNSKASSIGVFATDKSYYGRHGLSLKLDGLDAGFNDHADGRAVVMHGGWYVNETFIKKYGRAGRSWGCPALPSELTASIINTIKEDSILIAYYPNERWFSQSKFLKCDSNHADQFATGANQSIGEIEQREAVYFAGIQGKHVVSESLPVIVMPAKVYEQSFHITPPLTRMLRRQIQNEEYIALTGSELQQLASDPNREPSVYFVIPQIKMVRGYYATEMKFVDFGKIKAIEANLLDTSKKSFTIHFDTRAPIDIHASTEFVRWIGL